MKRSTRRTGGVLRLAALTAAIGLLLGPAQRAAAADPFDVYVIAPLTGNNAFTAKDARDLERSCAPGLQHCA